jgi:SAM-dependent methyltransferase
VQEPQFQTLYESVFDRLELSTGMRYLDVGCGSGIAVALAAARGAAAAGLDAAEGLLAVARRRVPHADLKRGDMEVLPFGERDFDLVTGFNAFQYAGNPVIALREAGRVAKRSGAVVIATWGEPNGMPVVSVIAALKSLLPPPPPDSPGPFALSSERALREFAAAGGLQPHEVFDVTGEFVFRDEDSAIRGFNSAGIAVRAMELTSEKAVRDAHAKALAPFRLADGSYRIGAKYRCIVARPL